MVDALHAQALAVYADSAFVQGNFLEAIRLAEQSLQMARMLSNRRLEALSLSFLGLYVQAQGDTERGILLLEQSLAIYRALGDKIGQADVLMWFPNDRYLEYVKTCFSESMKLHRELGNLAGISESLLGLASITIRLGDITSPTPWLEEAVSISRQLGNHASAWAIARFGDLTYWQGNYGRAYEYYEEALMLCQITGNHFLSLWIRVHIAYIFMQQGDIQQAREMFEDTVRDMQKADVMIGVVYAIEGLASLNHDRPKRVAQLFAWADTMRMKIGDQRPPLEQADIDRIVAQCLVQMGENAFSDAYEEGQEMTLDEAIAYAVGEG